MFAKKKQYDGWKKMLLVNVTVGFFSIYIF